MAKTLKTTYGHRVLVEEAVGFAVFNPCSGNYIPCIAGDDAEVLPTYARAKRERDSLAKEHDNETLEVVAICLLPQR